MHLKKHTVKIYRLQKAGAVLIAKLATGEMAFDDVWWGGKVKNPWNLAEGSSGSSAGPAAAVVAGAVAFAVRPLTGWRAGLRLHLVSCCLAEAGH